MLREETKCYSSIELEYDNGVNLLARKYYDAPVYEGLEAVNGVIAGYGFPVLRESDNFTAFSAADKADELKESWLYFFDYDLNLYVTVPFNDREETETYLEQYGQVLTDSGYSITNVEDSDEIDHYQSPEGFRTFRYHFEDDDSVTLLFRSQRYIPADEARTLIREAGFPDIGIVDPVECRDLVRFEKIQYGLDFDLCLTVSMSFPSTQEGGEFFDNYEAALTDAGFGRDNPDNHGLLKPISIYNEDTGLLVGIDFIERDDGGADINYEFRRESD